MVCLYPSGALRFWRHSWEKGKSKRKKNSIYFWLSLPQQFNVSGGGWNLLWLWNSGGFYACFYIAEARVVIVFFYFPNFSYSYDKTFFNNFLLVCAISIYTQWSIYLCQSTSKILKQKYIILICKAGNSAFLCATNEQFVCERITHELFIVILMWMLLLVVRWGAYFLGDRNANGKVLVIVCLRWLLEIILKTN